MLSAMLISPATPGGLCPTGMYVTGGVSVPSSSDIGMRPTSWVPSERT
jgi:hypothetical protein